MRESHLAPFTENWSIWKSVLVRTAGFSVDQLELLKSSSLMTAAKELHSALLKLEKCRADIVRLLDEDHPGGHKKTKSALRAGRIPSQIGGTLKGVQLRETLTELTKYASERQGEFLTKYSSHEEELSLALKVQAEDPQFQSALYWQNPKGASVALRKTISVDARPNSSQRRGQVFIAKYLQRYCSKNDTIGFFGPTLWGEIDTSTEQCRSKAGTNFIKERRVFVEAWCGHELLSLIGGTAEVMKQLVPRLHPRFRIAEDNLIIAGRGPVELSARIAKLLASTGDSTAAELVALFSEEFGGEGEVEEVLEELVEQGVLIWEMQIPHLVDDLTGKLKEECKKLEGIGAENALKVVDVFERQRLKVEQAQSCQQRIYESDKFLKIFEDTTGRQGTRNSGEMYAGRELLFEDCVRDHELVLGNSFLEGIRTPMSCVLESARWFVHEGAREFQKIALREFRRLRREENTVDGWSLLVATSPFLEGEGPDSLVGKLNSELSRKWAKIIKPDPNASEICRSGNKIWEAVQSEFVAEGEVWPGAIFQSPDIMIAAKSLEDWCAGKGLAVMGELHVGTNTATAPAVHRWNHARELVEHGFLSDVGDRFVEIVPAKGASSRANNVSPSNETYELLVDESRSRKPKGKEMRIADMIVFERDGKLFVRNIVSNNEFSLLETFQTTIRARLIQAFEPFRFRNGPRVMIDNFVVARRSWVFEQENLPSFPRRGSEQYLKVVRWAQEYGFPERVFYKSKEEAKPVLLDFASPTSIEIFAAIAKRSSLMTVSEMLPTPEDSWFRDHEDRGFTAELRVVFTDERLRRSRNKSESESMPGSE